ncbi:uncharacterized protein [Apostichopus japonicus]|uniref:uncharacterized protein isoform X3 n=1 Tax=Stichopus japonicus TaxID=307972 RepID=UPI003AB4B9A8
MTYKIQVIAVTTLLLWQTLLSYGQNAPVKMTFLGREPFESEYNTAQYQCHLSEPDNIAATAHVESFRAVWTRNDANENVDPPVPVWIDDIIYKHWKVTLDNYGNNDAFGVFGCEAALDGRISTSISGIFMRSDADIVPSDELVSVTANAGDTGVSIGMKSTGLKNVADFRWSKDNVRNNAFNGDDTWVISGQVEVDDAGVYECHINNERSDAKQGLKLLIVRACPAHRWGPDACGGICDNCYNGGICDENSGKCICAPGFKGANCEEGCGGNRYGDACLKKCSSIDEPEKCSTYLFCLAHPYGCSCNTGWKGLDCLTACDSGTYGASCLQTCHCQSGQCSRYTGVCTGSPPGCSSGWTGTNCQVPDVCTTSYYGSTCTDKCHCMGNVACDKITGECPGQSCAPGYEVHMGQVNCAECLWPRFGYGCEGDCHCSESYCNKVTGSCSGVCNPEWVELFPPNLCQTGIIDAAYTRKNPGVTVPVTCTAAKGPSPTDINNLNFVLSRHHEHLYDDGISSEQWISNATTRAAAFMVDTVIDGQTLYCQLRKDDKRYAVYNITIDVFDLPLLQSAPKADLITDSTVTISWSAWDEENEDGDPPVIGYTPYYKLASGLNWSIQDTSTSIKTLNFTFTALIPEERYSFCVAAVREGEMGEGPKSPALNATTICAGSVGLIVGVTIGTVSLAIIALLAVYGIWKYRRSTSKPKTVERQADDSKEVTNEAPFAYENVSKDSGRTNVVRYVPSKKHEECILSATGNDDTTDGYEIPSTRKDGGAQAKQESNKCENMEDVQVYQNNADDEFSLRKPMAISRFPLFMRSSTAKEMISATFKILEEISPSTNAISFSGASPENLHKNRFGDIVPLDNHRPLLKSMCLTQGGNDYINASVVNIPGLNQTLIMTQAPLPNTVEDFWRLVFDYQCQTIIMLNESDSGNHNTIKYWPDVNDIKIGTMTISTCLIEKKQLYTIHQCQVAHRSYRESIKVNRFILNDWPKSGDSLTPLINFIAATGFGSRGATLIHCINGASRSGIYVTVCSEINRMKTRQTIQVFDTVKNIKVCNPNAIITKEDYMMCHQLLNCYLTEMQDYDVIV